MNSTAILRGGTVLLGLLLMLHLWKPDGFFSLANERGLPSFISTLLMVAAAVASARLWWKHRGREIRVALAVFFCILLALDEWLSLHEPLNRALHEAMGSAFWLGGGWVLGLFFASAVVVAAIAPLVARFSRRSLRLLAFAIGLAAFGGIILEAVGLFFRWKQIYPASIHPLAATEELFEMAGMLVLLAGLVEESRPTPVRSRSR